MIEYKEYKVGDRVKFDDGDTVDYGTVTKIERASWNQDFIEVWAFWEDIQREEWVGYANRALSKLQQEPKQPQKRFEYQYITFQVTEKSEFIEELNKLGEEGWQMVGRADISEPYFDMSYKIGVYLMREKVDE